MRERRLHVDARVAGADGQRVRLGGRQAGQEGAVHQQAPDLLEGHRADQVLDVDAAVAERAALLVGLGDLGREGDDALEARLDLGACCAAVVLRLAGARDRASGYALLRRCPPDGHSPHRAPDRLRHLRPRRHQEGCRVRQGLAGLARHPRRGARGPRPARCWPPRSGRRRGRRSCCTATWTWSRPRGAVRAPDRGRPALRPRRLRHEGRARGDDGRARRSCASSAACGWCFAVVPDEESEEEVDRGTELLIRNGFTRRLRDHRRADRPAHRRAGQGRARDAARGGGDGRPRRDALARRQRDPEGARHLPLDRVAAVRARELGPVRPALDQPRAGSSAATRSTRCPTRA